MSAPLPDGLYEAVITPRLAARIAATSHDKTIVELDPKQLPTLIGQRVGDAVRDHLESLSEDKRLDAVAVLERLLESLGDNVTGTELLRAVIAPGTSVPERPTIPLTEGALFTNGPGEPNVGSELALEMKSADHVDLLCAFVKYHGVRALAPQFAELRVRGIRPRVLTTTYIGATDRRALDMLVNDYGAEVRVCYETTSTRLHAKAWIFSRDSGFDTAYVGSSNLSKAAITDGLEWNVRLSATTHFAQIAKSKKLFDQYWNSSNFLAYDPERDAETLDRALQDAGGSGGSATLIQLSGLEVRPLPHQQIILDSLDRERRVYDRHRNLVIAATGTGKTVVAALDYARLCTSHVDRPRLLFVAHRKEILTQALQTYREVLGDASFGELYVDGERPSQWQHVFASIQSVSRADSLPRVEWDVVVIDEFHHAAASSYRSLLSSVVPGELLGLTATPLRGDGVDVREFFGGRAAEELPLWKALSEDLLCPFHYFGIADGTDLSDVAFTSGHYDAGELSNLYTGNDARALLIIKALNHNMLDPTRMRALGFCVSVAHAEFMARVFTERGIVATTVTGATPSAARTRAAHQLKTGEIQCIFTVDVFNEGVDIPEVDVVLMLRPTASSTVFVQQLGRGLRRTRHKDVLIVLDFVGHHRADFALADRYRALTGSSRKQMTTELQTGFPSLPGASRILLDPVTQAEVLTSIKNALTQSTLKALTADARHLGIDTRLPEFLDQSERTVDDVYRADRSWTSVRISAFGGEAISSDEKPLLNRLHRLRTVDDLERAREYSRVARALLAGGTVAEDDPWARMLIDFFLYRTKFASYADAGQQLSAFPRVLTELVELMEVAATHVEHTPEVLTGHPHGTTLRSHARYQREELLSALGWPTPDKRPGDHREGVAWCAELQTDLLLINLRKDAKSFTPSTMYRDLPVSRDLFDWESQSTTRQQSPTGQRYLHQRDPTAGTDVLLAVRMAPNDEVGTAPFLLLGNADLESYSGEQPIAIRWRLRRPMPADLLAQALVAAE